MGKIFSSYIFQCQTAVHAGDGTSTGTIDMPIQRERTTGFPVFRDSTTRGGVRESFETTLESPENAIFKATFGNKDNGDVASALDVLPARLLFFPVRSIKGVFAYVTCPFVLKRFAKEMELFHKTDIKINIPKLTNDECFATDELLINKKYLGLEEFRFEKIDNNFDINEILKLIDTNEIDWLPKHYAIIDDTSFAYFTRLFTEKVTRNKIDIKTGMAEDGGLFNEEFLPEESILYTTFGFSNEFSDKDTRKEDTEIQNYFDTNFNEIFQLGGDKSIGKGLINRYRILFESSKETTKTK